MKNQVIKVLSKEHGKKVIAYWKSRGFDTGALDGYGVGAYYGPVNGYCECLINLSPNTELITLPNEYPKVMWVWDDNEFDARKRVVFMEKLGKYLAWSNSETLEQAENTWISSVWNNAKDIEEPQIVELTIKDISEGKGVGVDPKFIRIKE